jgi:hypothetical protein
LTSFADSEVGIFSATSGSHTKAHVLFGFSCFNDWEEKHVIISLVGLNKE